MRVVLLGPLISLASTAPAQQPAQPPDSGQLDTLIPADGQAVQAAPEPTGDAILERLNALEARVSQLEAENARLKRQAQLDQGRLETVENRAAKAAQFGWVSTISNPNGNFTFKPRGWMDADAVLYRESAGGYRFNDGTQFSRLRLGFEGTAFKWFNYRMEVDFANTPLDPLGLKTKAMRSRRAFTLISRAS